jgi:hypothetical protein
MLTNWCGATDTLIGTLRVTARRDNPVGAWIKGNGEAITFRETSATGLCAIFRIHDEIARLSVVHAGRCRAAEVRQRALDALPSLRSSVARRRPHRAPARDRGDLKRRNNIGQGDSWAVASAEARLRHRRGVAT